MNQKRPTSAGNGGRSTEFFGAPQHAKSNSLIGLIRQFIVQFFRSVPFSVRAMLRKDIGSMTFSWLNILLAALWVRFLLDGTFSLAEFRPPDSFLNELLTDSSAFYYLILPFWYLGMFFAQFGKVITEFIPERAGGSFSDFVPFFLSCFILMLGIAQKYNTKRKHDLRISFDPMSSGKSIYFEGLLDRLQVKDRERTLLWIEIGLLLFLSLIVYIGSSRTPELLNYAGFFLAGAIGLFIEDQATVFRKRQELEYRFASEYRAHDIQEAYEEYQGLDVGVQAMATVSFVGMDRQALLSKASQDKAKSLPLVFDSSKQSWTVWKSLFERYAKPLLALVFLLPVLIWLLTSSSKSISYVGVVTTENLTLRKKSKRTSEPIARLPQGTVLQITQCDIVDRDGREWCHIITDDAEGYAVKKGSEGTSYLWAELIEGHIIDIGLLPFEDRVWTTEGGSLNLRSSPSLSASILNPIPSGTLVHILEQSSSPSFLEVNDQLIFGAWLKVDYLGQEGYCFSWYLEECRIPSTLF